MKISAHFGVKEELKKFSKLLLTGNYTQVLSFKLSRPGAFLTETPFIKSVGSIPKNKNQRWEKVFCSCTSCFLTCPGPGSTETDIVTKGALTDLQKLLPPFRSFSLSPSLDFLCHLANYSFSPKAH